MFDGFAGFDFVDYSQPINWGSELATGLIGFWMALPGLDQGNTLHNLCQMSAGPHGTLTNGPTWVGSPYGNAIRFDGTDDYVNIGDVNALDGIAGMTVVCDWSPTNITQTLKSIFAKWDTAANSGWIVETGWTGVAGQTSGLIVACGSAANDYGETAAGILVAGQRKNLTIVFDGAATGNANRLKLYVDSAPITLTFHAAAAIPTTTPATTHSLRIGATSDAQRFAAGGCGALLTYDRAFSQAEVTALNEEQKQGFPTLVNRVWSPSLHVAAAAATAYPWHYYQQQHAMMHAG